MDKDMEELHENVGGIMNGYGRVFFSFGLNNVHAFNTKTQL
jgi:hypothetical protein